MAYPDTVPHYQINVRDPPLMGARIVHEDSPYMHTTLYRGARNPVPLRTDQFATWDEYVDALHDIVSDTAADKTALLAIGPHRLRTPYRARENVAAATCLAIDVDKCDLKALAARIDCAAIVYGSPSDEASGPSDARRVRVLAPVSREMTPDECGPARLAFAERLGLAPGCGVESCLDAARLYFIGRIEGTPEREWRTWDGAAVDVDALLARPLVHSWTRDVATATTVATDAPARLSPARDAAIGAVVSALGDAHDHDGRKWQICGALGGLTRRLGWRVEECAALIRTWLPAGDPSVDVTAGVTWACAAWVRPASEVTGAGALRELVGREVGDAIIAVATTLTRTANAADRVCATEGTPVTATGATSVLGRAMSWTAPDVPIEYMCHGLRLAPSDGKISFIAGAPGGGKGPIADHLAVCFALGAPAFGVHDCTRANVLLIDCEGARLTMRRCRRMVRAIGRDPSELDGALHMVNASNVLDFTDTAYLDALTQYVHAHSIRVIVLDSYTSAMLRGGVDSNSPQYARLAQALGALDALVICVGHANKAAASRGGTPLLGDLAGSFAIGGMAATAIVVHYPQPEDRNLVYVGCARAPEEGFASFGVRFGGASDAPLTLTVEALPDTGRGATRACNAQRVSDTRRNVTLAGTRIWRHMVTESVVASFDRRALMEAAGACGRDPTREALVRLREAGLVESLAGQTGLTEAGRGADEGTVARALAGGGVEGFER
jgi:hypothetical protein